MKISITLICLCLTLTVFAQEEADTLKMDWEAYDPPSTLVVPETQITQAKFPFVDVHSHHWRMAEQDLDLLIRQMDSMNMQVIVNLSGRGGERLKAMMDNVKKYGHEDRIIIFTNIELRSIDAADWTEETIKQIEFDHSVGARGLKIYKSQGMSNRDSSGNRIRINDERLDPIWEKCGELGMPVLIHSADPKSFWQPHDENNERWLELKIHSRRLQNEEKSAAWETIIGEHFDIIRKHPQTNFISAHMSWHANDLQQLGKLLDELPNMYVEIGAVIAELGRQPRMAKRFFEKYQDRVLFGKDAYHPSEYPTYFRVLESDDEYFPYYKRYHAFWKMYGLDLPDKVLEKLYYKNALKLIKGLDKSMWKK